MATKTSLTLAERFVKQLRKTPKTIPEIAGELGVPYQSLSRLVPQIVADGKAIKKVDGRVAKYSKP